jgi:ligand-binding sensor domain-containing protein/serine phosphatase RsbU (regulator of sigma subunit)
MKKHTFLIILFFAVTACNRSPKDDGTAPLPLYPQPQSIEAKPNGGYAVNMVTGDTIQPLVNTLGDTIKTGVPIPAKGKVVQPDSMAEPKVVLVDESKLKKIPAGNPKVVPTNTNVHPVGNPKMVMAGIPRVIVPGTDTFSLPKKIPAIDSSFVAGVTEITLAKDPAVKDQNPGNLSSFSKLQGLKHGNIMCILEDKSGNLWFGTGGGGVSKYDGKSFTHFTDKEGLSNNFVFSLLEDKSGNLWFGTNGGGVSKYDGKSFTHFTDKEGLSNNFVFSLLEDKSGNLWFGTYGGGVSKYDGNCVDDIINGTNLYQHNQQDLKKNKKDLVKSFTHFTDKEGLSNNVVLTILEDKSGNLWFGTEGGGVSKYDGKSFTHFTDKEGLSNNDVVSILEDKFGNLWFGTEGGGVSKYDGNCVDDIINGTNLYQHNQQDLKKNKKDLVKSFTHFTDKEGLSNNNVFSILEDKSGNLWFGTYGGGVSKYDGKSFTHFTNKEGLSNNYVRNILEDKSGNLWFGTGGGGVSKYDGKCFTHFTDKEGLSNNVVLSILEDKSGNLWFGTRFGLSKLSSTDLAEINEKVNTNNIKEEDVFFKNYTYEDGFLGIGVNGGNTICEDKNGTIWIGANDRLTAYHPEGENKDTVAPNIQLTSIALFNENISWANLKKKKNSTLTLGNGVIVSNFEFDGLTKWYGLPENLSLAYNDNYLTFQFIGITMRQPKKVRYQYKLEGIDENWSALTNRTEAPYGNLPNGTYTFKVKAMNSEGVWSKPFEYTFTIRPPWWRTWWAYAFYVAAFISGLFSYIKWRESALKARQKQLEEKVDEATLLIRNQKDEVEKQKQKVQEKNTEILSSIEYAKRIQTAILPPPRVVKEFLKNSFILYLPKDIVAGDFYWMDSVEETIYFAACDCTGHGVPGAMVSVVCNNALNRSLNEYAERAPGRIFDRTRALVLESFSKSDEEVKDGMDASLCALHLQTMKLQWAGANNPLWIFRSATQTIEEHKPDKQPIGKGYEQKPFTTHEIALHEGDILYLFTDGYADQFGGEKGRKLTRARFREFLLGIAHLDMEQQRESLLQFHDEYRGEQEQVDDICVMGVRV